MRGREQWCKIHGCASLKPLAPSTSHTDAPVHELSQAQAMVHLGRRRPLRAKKMPLFKHCNSTLCVWVMGVDSACRAHGRRVTCAMRRSRCSSKSRRAWARRFCHPASPARITCGSLRGPDLVRLRASCRSHPLLTALHQFCTVSPHGQRCWYASHHTHASVFTATVPTSTEDDVLV